MRVLFLSFFIILADQISKLFVKGFSIPFLHFNTPGMHYGESIDVVGTIFRITFVENPGMAFGIEVGSSKIFLSLFSLVASIAILIYIYKVRNQHLVFRIALAFIFAGAVGNLIDRTFYGIFYGYAPIFYGKVVDFLHVNYFGFTLFGKTYSSFPIFNIADSSVTVGVIILLIFNYIFEKRKSNASILGDEEKAILDLSNSDELKDENLLKSVSLNSESDLKKKNINTEFKENDKYYNREKTDD